MVNNGIDYRIPLVAYATVVPPPPTITLSLSATFFYREKFLMLTFTPLSLCKKNEKNGEAAADSAFKAADNE